MRAAIENPDASGEHLERAARTLDGVARLTHDLQAATRPGKKS